MKQQPANLQKTVAQSTAVLEDLTDLFQNITDQVDKN